MLVFQNKVQAFDFDASLTIIAHVKLAIAHYIVSSLADLPLACSKYCIVWVQTHP